MTITKIIVDDNIVIESGKTKQINATTDGDTSKEKEITFNCGDFLSVNNNGKLIADKVLVDKISTLTITSTFNRNIHKTVPINILKSKPLKITPENTFVFSGETIQFEKIFDFEINPYWEVEEHNRTTGDIDINTGIFTPPYPITKTKEINIKLTDRRTGQKAKTKLTLKPIKITKGKQTNIPAGSDKNQLNILVENDFKNGKNYFDCKIISNPAIGIVEEGGIYKPPSTVNEVKEVEIMATHKDSTLIWSKLSFNVVPSCPKCKIELAGDSCPNCGFSLSENTPIERCPNCKSERWNGVRCRDCGYPRSRKHY